MPSSLLNQLQYAAASNQVMPPAGQLGLECFQAYWFLKFPDIGQRRNCSLVTGVPEIANVRPIRFVCCLSLESRAFSVGGEPIVKVTGPGITIRVCPWPL